MFRRLALLVLLLAPLAAPAQDAHTLLHLLDYVGVDYGGAVENGKVKSADEYREMQEFVAQAAARVRALPPNPKRDALAAQADALKKLVADRASPVEVASAAGTLRHAIVAAYQLRLAPRVAPPMDRAAVLYAKNCAACHGAVGRGDGPAARGLDPAPADFHDAPRMAQRSVYGLYNTITLGVAGTSMVPFKQLTDEQRWALAYYAGSLGTSAARVEEGKRLWAAGNSRAAFPDLGNVATLSRNEVAAQFGEDAARVQDYLRSDPRALRPAPLAYARQRIADARDAVRSGDRAGARDAAIQAYLEGYELVEAPLANVDPDLMQRAEREMLELRAAIERAEPAEAFAQRVARVDGLLAAAQEKLAAGELTPGSAFAASVVILLREGLEAILVLAAIIAFVLKTGRRDALAWVHAGWVAALVLGGLTWVAATYAFEITGANRELSEGITALAAAVMLLYVGYWLHSKSYADAWTRFIREQVGQALAKRTLWAMATLSFVAVYREVFEIVLFYQTLWIQAGAAGRHAVLAGIAAAAVALAAIGFAILKYSVRLPIGPFFNATSALLVVLAVVFTGHGVAALQEAGVLAISGLDFGAVPLLGIYPSREAVASQILVLVLIAATLLRRKRA
jgi:high-affinity iron transporter